MPAKSRCRHSRSRWSYTCRARCMHAEQYGTRVVGATSTSRPHWVISKAVTRVCFNASSLRSKVIARMWAASLLSLKNPEGNRRFHAHLFALCGAALEATVTVEKSRCQARLTHPLERQESHSFPSGGWQWLWSIYNISNNVAVTWTVPANVQNFRLAMFWEETDLTKVADIDVSVSALDPRAIIAAWSPINLTGQLSTPFTSRHLIFLPALCQTGVCSKVLWVCSAGRAKSGCMDECSIGTMNRDTLVRGRLGWNDCNRSGGGICEGRSRLAA